MNNANVNILPFHESKALRSSNLPYFYGRKFAIYSGVGLMPPFQLVLSKNETVSSFELIRCSDNVSTDIWAQRATIGMNIDETTSDDYNLLIYAGILPLSGTWSPQFYNVKVTTSTRTLFTDAFTMTTRVDQMLRLEFWHNENLKYSNGEIRYQFPYKTFIYIDTEVAKPTYPETREIDTRNGRNFITKQVSYKEFQFDALLTEQLADVLRLAPLHHNVVAIKRGRTYEIDEIEQTVEEWQREGDLCLMNFIFKTDTFVTVPSQTFEDVPYTAGDCGCIANAKRVVARLQDGSTNHQNGQYEDENGDLQDIRVGSFVLVDIDQVTRLQVYRGKGSYASPFDLIGSVACFDNMYFFEHNFFMIMPTLQSATLVSGTTFTVVGLTFPNISTQVWGKISGTWTNLGSYTSTQLAAGVDIDLQNATVIQMRPITESCNDFANSNELNVSGTGIGAMAIGSSFTIT